MVSHEPRDHMSWGSFFFPQLNAVSSSWSRLQPVGVRPRKFQNPQAEAFAT